MIRGFYSKGYIEDNILEVWEAVSPISVEETRGWYREMNTWCRRVSNDRVVDMYRVVGCFAALSPQNSVRMNKSFLESYFDGVHKHTKANMTKCDKIMSAEETGVDDILHGEKTVSFYNNILRPLEATRVTIDRHCFTISGIDKKSVTPLQYRHIEEVWAGAADRVSLLPHEFQACLWTHYRQSLGKDIMYD